MHERTASFTAFGLLLGAAVMADELQPLSSIDLHERCLAYRDAPDSEAGKACTAYVRGFIEGSPEIVIAEVHRTEQDESFTDRAWRTRLGHVRGEPRYCIGADTSLADIIEQLLRHAETKPPSEELSASGLLLG